MELKLLFDLTSFFIGLLFGLTFSIFWVLERIFRCFPALDMDWALNSFTFSSNCCWFFLSWNGWAAFTGVLICFLSGLDFPLAFRSGVYSFFCFFCGEGLESSLESACKTFLFYWFLPLFCGFGFVFAGDSFSTILSISSSMETGFSSFSSFYTSLPLDFFCFSPETFFPFFPGLIDWGETFLEAE